MARDTDARRYAQAVFQIALEKGELDRWQADLEKVAALGEDRELVALLENPRLPFEEKQKLLSGRFTGVNELALNLVYLLLTRNSLALVGEVANEYRLLLDSHRGIEEAEVTTAVPLEEEDRKSLEERLGAMVGKRGA